MSKKDIAEQRLRTMKTRLQQAQARARQAACTCMFCTLRRTLEAGGIGTRLPDGMVEIKPEELGLTPEAMKGMSQQEIVERVLQAAQGGAKPPITH